MQNDHDLLIRLDTQVQLVLSELKDIKLQTTAKVTELDSRVSTIERVSASDNFGTRIASLEKTRNLQEDLNLDFKEIKNTVEWIKDFRVTWKYVAGGLGALGTILGLIASWLVAVTHVLGH